jgi:hypothetical protein
MTTLLARLTEGTLRVKVRAVVIPVLTVGVALRPGVLEHVIRVLVAANLSLALVVIFASVRNLQWYPSCLLSTVSGHPPPITPTILPYDFSGFPFTAHMSTTQ